MSIDLARRTTSNNKKLDFKKLENQDILRYLVSVSQSTPQATSSKDARPAESKITPFKSKERVDGEQFVDYKFIRNLKNHTYISPTRKPHKIKSYRNRDFIFRKRHQTFDLTNNEESKTIYSSDSELSVLSDSNSEVSCVSDGLGKSSSWQAEVVPENNDDNRVSQVATAPRKDKRPKYYDGQDSPAKVQAPVGAKTLTQYFEILNGPNSKAKEDRGEEDQVKNEAGDEEDDVQDLRPDHSPPKVKYYAKRSKPLRASALESNAEKPEPVAKHSSFQTERALGFTKSPNSVVVGSSKKEIPTFQDPRPAKTSAPCAPKPSSQRLRIIKTAQAERSPETPKQGKAFESPEHKIAKRIAKMKKPSSSKQEKQRVVDRLPNAHKPFAHPPGPSNEPRAKTSSNGLLKKIIAQASLFAKQFDQPLPEILSVIKAHGFDLEKSHEFLMTVFK